MAPWSTLRCEEPAGSGNSLILCYLQQDELPRVALETLVMDPETEDLRYILTFYRRRPAYAGSSGPLRVDEMLSFDTLGYRGLLLVERIIVYRSAFLDSTTPDRSPARVLMLPVRWTATTELRDTRVPVGQAIYDSDATTWPQDIREVLQPW